MAEPRKKKSYNDADTKKCTGFDRLGLYHPPRVHRTFTSNCQSLNGLLLRLLGTHDMIETGTFFKIGTTPHRPAESVGCRFEFDDPVAFQGSSPVMGEP